MTLVVCGENTKTALVRVKKRYLASAASVVLTVGLCAVAGTAQAAGSTNQTWQFSFSGKTGSQSATFTCPTNGACAPASLPTTSGCPAVSLHAQFSGEAVRLSGAGSCSLGSTTVSFALNGEGQANAPYPNATSAQGTMTETAEATVTGVSGGQPASTTNDFSWTATRTGGSTTATTKLSSAPVHVTVTGGGHTTLVYGVDVTDNGTGTISTDEYSTATLVLANGDTLDLGPDSSVQVLSGNLFDLEFGRLRLWWTHFVQGLGESSVSSSYARHRGVTAVMTVRGTEAVVINQGPKSIFQDLEGHVAVSDPSHKGTVNLTTGQQITVVRGSIPKGSQVVPVKNVYRFWPSAHTASVVSCPIPANEYNGTPYAPQSPPATVSVAASPPEGAQFYGTVFPGGSPSYLLGATGATCQAAFGSADGAAFMTATSSTNPSQRVTMVLHAGGAGPETDLACPYIPATLAAEKAFRGNTSLCVRPSGDVVRQIPTGGTNLYAAAVWVPASVKDPNLTSSGDGTDPTVALYTAQVIPPQSAGQPQTANAQMVSCTLPATQRKICAASLAYFLATQSDVGTHVPRAGLTKMQDALSTFLSKR
ncbi:MAG: hypothetical protein ACLQCU_16525 [Acidimicrobiales bacterium]